MAEMIPIGTLVITATISDMIPSWSVYGMPSLNCSNAGLRVTNEVPRSPRNTLPTYFT